MTRGAVYRRLPLFVAVETIAHIHVDGADRDRLPRHVPVTRLAIDSGADVGRVVKLHVRRWAIVIDALPGYVFTSLEVCREFPDLTMVCGNELMARHAELHAWQRGVRTGVYSGVTVDALHAVRKVDLVRIGDGLDRRPAPAEEVPYGVKRVTVRRREHRGAWRGGLRRRTPDLGGQYCPEQRPSETASDDHDHHREQLGPKPSKPHAASRFPRPGPEATS